MLKFVCWHFIPNFSDKKSHSSSSVTSLPFVSPCRSSIKDGRVANRDIQKEEIFTEYLRSVFGKKWDVLISQEGRNAFYLISSNRGRQIATIIAMYSSSTRKFATKSIERSV